MRSLLHRLSGAALAIALVNCAGEPAGLVPSSPATTAGAASTARRHKVKAVIRITIHKHRHHRRILVHGHYVSAATQSIAIAITPQGGSPTNYNQDLTPATNPGCVETLFSPLICTITLYLAPGNYTANFSTYDGLLSGGNAANNPPTGNELSADQNVPFTISVGLLNQINATLGGLPASVTLLPLSGAMSGNTASGFTISGCPLSTKLEVLGLDADNNVILGPGAPTPVLSSGDPSRLIVSASPAPSSPNVFTLSGTNIPNPNGVVQVTASVVPSTGSGGSTKTAHVNITTALCGVYVTDSGNAEVKELLAVGGSVPASPTINVLGPTSSAPVGVAVDGSGNLYVSDFFTDVYEMLAVGGQVPASPTIVGFTSGTDHLKAIALDASNNIYVVGLYSNVVNEIFAAGGYTTRTTLGSGFTYPEGIAVDGSGNVYVDDQGTNTVREIAAIGGTITVLGSGFDSPEGVAVDESGNVYVADSGSNSIKEMLAVGGSIPASPTIRTLGSGFSYPTAVAVDGAGNVYVADESNNAVKEIVAVGGTIPASPTIISLGSGYSSPSGIALR